MWIPLLLQILGSFVAFVVTRLFWQRWKYDLHRIPAPPTLPFLFESFRILKSTDKGELSQLRGRWWKKLGCPKISKVRNHQVFHLPRREDKLLFRTAHSIQFKTVHV